MSSFKKCNLAKIIPFVFVAIYFLFIVLINFSGNPSFYCTDMYSDMTYAEEVWNHKSIFPENWTFGNQLYVVATPVLAALFYGITSNHSVAMGLAATLSGLCVVLSFLWMIKPVFPDIRMRITVIAIFMSLMLFSGNPVHALGGWQLLFTLCAYYACYAITSFLAFGCYLRRDSKWSYALVIPFILTCLLSFGTGIQSLRQTAIMVCPLIAAEFLHIVSCKIQKKKAGDKSCVMSILITLSNLAGVIYSKQITVKQVEIFGNIEICSIKEMISNILPSLNNIGTLLSPAGDNMLPFIVILVVCVVTFLVYTFYLLSHTKNKKAMECLILLELSVVVIFIINIFCSMEVRSIYYFMIYPLLAFSFFSVYHYSGKYLRTLCALFLAILISVSCVVRLVPVVHQINLDNPYEEVVDYLKENNISTIFSQWNIGEKIAISSNWEIQAGYWFAQDRPFEKVTYLCNPDIFNVDATQCAYVFFNKGTADIAMEIATDMNADFVLLNYFPASDIYIFASSSMLMHESVTQ